MRRFIRNIVLASTMLTAGTAAFGQYYNDRPPYGEPNSYQRDRMLFDRVRADLDRASHYPYSSRADFKRFDEARRELAEFENRFDRGRYDKHELDEAISRIQRVVDHNSLDPRDRGVLQEDLRRMRDFRSYHDHYGDYSYGYRR